jgi:integrase/recombinase XerD
MITACAYTLYLDKLSSTSQRSIHSQLRSIGQRMGWSSEDIATRFQSIDYQTAMQIRAMLVSARCSARSINRAMTAIKGIVKIAVILGKVDQLQSLQIQSITNLKHGEYKGSALSAEQATALLVVLKNANTALEIRNAAITTVLLGTGLRRSEVCMVKLQQLKPEERTLFVAKGKGNKTRTVFLPQWVFPFLERWLLLRGKQQGYLFCGVGMQHNHAAGSTQKKEFSPVSRQDSTLLSRLNAVPRVVPLQVDSALDSSTIYRIVQSLTKAIGLEDISPHDLRRTFITRLLEQNVDINTVRQMAGHASIATTTIYDKRDQRFMKHAAETLHYQQQTEDTYT